MSTTTSRTAAPTGDPSAIISQQQQQPPPNVTNYKPTPPPPPPRQLQSIHTSGLFILEPPPLNLPKYKDLPSETRESYNNICVLLYESSLNGDWKAAKLILDRQTELVRRGITHNHDTALHIATAAQHTKFVQSLLELMKEEDLELQNIYGNTALCLAASAGDVQLIKMMVNKNKKLLSIPGYEGVMPLYRAALVGNHDSLNYLYDASQKMTGNYYWIWYQNHHYGLRQNRVWVLIKCIEADLFDIALKIVVDRPEVAQNVSVLLALAQKRHAFHDKKPYFMRIINSIQVKIGHSEKRGEAMELANEICKNIMKMPKLEVDKLLRGPHKTTMKNGMAVVVIKDGKRVYPSRILFVAVEMGNTSFVIELIHQYPELIWELNDNNQSIFHVAVSHRQERIYSVLHEIGVMKDMITPLKDLEENNMLHLVGKIAEKNRLQDVSGVAFQMQRELLWFKEVEAMIPPYLREKKNAAGLTPRELFTKNHRELVSKGEEWIRGTANQCMVVAALIATMVFGVAFSIPGGYQQDNGLPMFIRKEIYIAFVLSDAISLFSSAASILMFLSMLTSRYAEQDFLEVLPKQLMIGLATLFVSIMTMMIAFSFSFFVLYHNKLIWVPIIIGVVAAIPVFLYAKLQYPLLMDIYRSIYGSRYIFKPKRRMIYINYPNY